MQKVFKKDFSLLIDHLIILNKSFRKDTKHLNENYVIFLNN
jgi:hypothetical protein